MSLDNTTVIENLSQQKTELEKALTELSSQLEQAKSQYLKVTGALDVLTQIEESKQSEQVIEEPIVEEQSEE